MNKEAFDAAMLRVSAQLRKAAEADPFADIPNVNNTQPNFNTPAASGPTTNWSAKPGMRMQMSPHAAMRRGARSIGNAAGQFAQAPANYLGQVGQSIGNAFNRATGQQPVAAPASPMPSPQMSTPQNSPWLANPNFQSGVQRMPSRRGQQPDSPYQLNPQYRGNGIQTADLRSRPQSAEIYSRNPNYRPGAANMPARFAPGRTKQQTIDQLLKRSFVAGGFMQQARNGVRSMLNTASNLPAAPAQQMGTTMANTFSRGAKGVANMMSASPIAAASRAAGNMFSRYTKPTAAATATAPAAPATSGLSTAGQNFRNRIREEKWQPNQPLPPDWFEQRLRSDQLGSPERAKAEYEAAGGFQRMGLLSHTYKYGPKEEIWRGV